jgi:hypothetical protein
MKTLATALLLAAFAAPSALAQEAAPKKETTLDFTLEPGKVHEHCVKLSKGQSRRFEWASNVIVDFIVHYHKGDAACYPFKANSRKSAKAKFTADHADEYCWMWTALKDTAKVTGVIK